MRIIKPAFTIEEDLLFEELGISPEQYSRAYMRLIEKLTRRCYKSEGKMTEDSWREFVPRIFNTNKHRGVIEHRVVTVSIYSDKGILGELVRHRLASYLAESTRYVNYGKRGLTYVANPRIQPGSDAWYHWVSSLMRASEAYNEAVEMGWKPEDARDLLPHAIKAEVGATMNLREWRAVFELRVAPSALHKFRQISVPLLKEFQKRFPGIFDDLEVPEMPYEPAKLIRSEDELEEIPI